MTISRRSALKMTGSGLLLANGLSARTVLAATQTDGIRCVNIINFIREIEGRFSMDMMKPVQEQMKLVLQHALPATWLLQFDALVSGPFVPFLKQNIASNHEVGFWFEMNRRHCEYAGIPYRGSPSLEWDPNPSVAFTLGYTPAERIRLADTAMREFNRVWGRYPSAVASWNLDAITIDHLSRNYQVDAFAICRDQFNTDGFSIWGAPIAGYYPSKTNCYSPAINPANQISTPVFRMLGQDPVYYYDGRWKLPDGRVLSEPDTMEPVWTSGKSALFVNKFIDMIEKAPTGKFAYAQIGQENTFPWEQQAAGYPPQMQALDSLRARGVVHVETLGETGRRFKAAFKTTPQQSQVMLDDPFGNQSPAAGSIWYQTRFYRANLHFAGEVAYLRDLFVYSDRQKQIFLDSPATSSNVEQRMLGVMDGYHWSKNPGTLDDEHAGIFFYSNERRLKISRKPQVQQFGNRMVAILSLQGIPGDVVVHFGEQRLSVYLTYPGSEQFSIRLQRDPSRSPPITVNGTKIGYRWQDFDYSVSVIAGTAQGTAAGWQVAAKNGYIDLQLAQDS